MRGHKADRCWQKGKGRGSKGDEEKAKGGSKGKDGPKDNGQILVTRGTDLGTIHIDTVKRTVLKWIRGRLVEPVPYLCAVSVS